MSIFCIFLLFLFYTYPCLIYVLISVKEVEAYAHRPEEMTRDMYSDRGSRFGYSHDEYISKRSEYPMTDPESAKHRKQLLNDYMDDLFDMAKEMVQDMSPDEKQMWKNKLAQISNM